MSGGLWPAGSGCLSNSAARSFWGFLCLVCFAAGAQAQERREREPNSVYAERRAKLAAQVDGPIILWGFTGREEISEAYVFAKKRISTISTATTKKAPDFCCSPLQKAATRRADRAKSYFFPQKIRKRKNGMASACLRRIPASKRALDLLP